MVNTDCHGQGGGYGAQKLAAASGRECRLYLELINNFDSDNVHAYIQTTLKDSDQKRLNTADGTLYQPVANSNFVSTPLARSADCGVRRRTALIFDFLTICSDLSSERCLAVPFSRAPFFSTGDHACAMILGSSALCSAGSSSRQFAQISQKIDAWLSILMSAFLLHARPCVPQHEQTLLPASIEWYDVHPYGSSRKRRRLMEDPQVQADNLHQLWADRLLDYFCLQGEYAGQHSIGGARKPPL